MLTTHTLDVFVDSTADTVKYSRNVEHYQRHYIHYGRIVSVLRVTHAHIRNICSKSSDNDDASAAAGGNAAAASTVTITELDKSDDAVVPQASPPTVAPQQQTAA